ncbi:hypothetical protein CAPTEDRAFT_228556 [Capitella teleta]|uniref:Uncharacterized protein n=1 Tax=Capitella teleta TaxID=283909 RepID=R7UBZ5_CAPTE|nr:hypothetical protein CAPTEDRAFT_228556 [Capitella teleta]|eukprot:ELU01318.1 hypothetical protein CAPTEDRAFT_228556 [Capitella teleta]
MVEQFTLAMGDTSETRCVMLDKDVNEIVANFKAKICELVVPVATKEEIFRHIRKIVYSSEEKFEELVEELREQSPDIHEYFMVNWWSERQMWADHLRRAVKTFGNNTNNRIESENKKLKTLMSSQTTIAEWVRSLFSITICWTLEREHKAFLQESTTVRYQDADRDLEELLGAISEYAADVLRTHLKVASNVVVGSVNEQGVYLETDGQKSYCVVDTLSRPLTTTQRYWKNDALTQRVKLLLNNCGVRESEERFRELANLVDKWENDQMALEEVAQIIETVTEDTVSRDLTEDSDIGRLRSAHLPITKRRGRPKEKRRFSRFRRQGGPGRTNHISGYA